MLTVFAVFGLWCAISAAAQQQPSAAVLLSGPRAINGIPVYAPNRIPAFEGVYRLSTASQAQQAETSDRSQILTVLYSGRDLLIPRSWTPLRCGTVRLYRVSDYEPFTICYRDESGFFLFFFFPESEPPIYWCSFAGSFVERFLFLFNIVGSRSDVPFPAILQLE